MAHMYPKGKGGKAAGSKKGMAGGYGKTKTPKPKPAKKKKR